LIKFPKDEVLKAFNDGFLLKTESVEQLVEQPIEVEQSKKVLKIKK
jgi:hypothetical protein